MQNIFETKKRGIFSKLAPTFYKWGLSPLPPPHDNRCYVSDGGRRENRHLDSISSLIFEKFTIRIFYSLSAVIERINTKDQRMQSAALTCCNDLVWTSSAVSVSATAATSTDNLHMQTYRVSPNKMSQHKHCDICVMHIYYYTEFSSFVEHTILRKRV